MLSFPPSTKDALLNVQSKYLAYEFEEIGKHKKVFGLLCVSFHLNIIYILNFFVKT